MSKYWLFTSVIILVMGCQSSGTKSVNTVDTLSNHPTKDSITDTLQPVTPQPVPDAVTEESHVFFDGTYRLDENEKADFLPGNQWLSLNEDNGQFELAKPDYTIEKGYDECSGMNTESLGSKHKTLVYLEFPQLKPGKVNALKITTGKIWPEESASFDFQGNTYTLKGRGKILSTEMHWTDDDKKEKFHEVKDYSLALTIDGKDQGIMLKESSFNDTFMELVFVGDLDKDGKLDFIFQVPRDYEEERVVVLLSSEGYTKQYTASRQFDC
ncbi:MULTISPECIES: hypothetical protein [unclassified Sphingobacterium]|uniref:hypothetical protein n=1 Tax=unclassified Sphingobacterium TaxID=2609468 RepID=UPI0025F0E7E7|nr:MULTISPECIES: hypothetical protein [unclassified Sphingobacterium]